MPRRGSPGHRRGQRVSSRELWNRTGSRQLLMALTLKWFLRYMLLSSEASLLAQTLCLTHSYLQKRQLQHHTLSNSWVPSRGCSALLFSAALLVIGFQCTSLKNTIRCPPANGAWIYFHQIKLHLMLPHQIQTRKLKADFLQNKTKPDLPFIKFSQKYIIYIYNVTNTTHLLKLQISLHLF